MTFDGIIFDLDGTLWDCTEGTVEAINETFRLFEIEHEVDLEFIRSITGRPASECDQLILENVPTNLQSQFIEEFWRNELEQIRIRANSSVYPGVREGLALLRQYYPLFVVSNCTKDYMDIFREHSDIGAFFEDVESHGATGKPKGDNIRFIQERNRLRRPCYIGDTSGDQSAAKDAGVPFFHVKYGFGLAEGEVRSFASFKELTDYLVSA